MDYLTYIGYLLKKIVHAAELKWIAGIFLSVFSFFFDPLNNLALFALFVLIIIDFALGVSASRYTGQQIQSAKLRRSAIKMAVYFTLIAAARVTEHAIPIAFLDETVTGFLAATELLSVLENVGRLGFAVPQKLVDILGDYTAKRGDKKPVAPEPSPKGE